VCLAILEYYAFEAGQWLQEEALRNFRRLAGQKLRELIYRELGYRPEPQIPLAVQQFLDRIAANHEAVPIGYFSVFKELADPIMTLIRAGAEFGPEFVPDISVGQHWSKHWADYGLDNKFGQRRQYEHNYPSSFPQSEANPQQAYCYPDMALGYFKKWMHEVYLEVLIQPYLKGAEKRGKLPKAFTDVALRALAMRPVPKQLS
jgi:hypothetical protein